jgi:hypothetical protein
MKPRKVVCKFNDTLFNKCKQFAQDSLGTSVDQYARRGQDPSKYYRMIIQLINGKLGEEMDYHVFLPYYPNLTAPDYNIYDKKNKSWKEDLIDNVANIRLAAKTKDKRDADQWGPSWIFEKTDKKIFGEKLDNKNLDPRQYVVFNVVDQIGLQGRVLACVSLQWLHDKNLFEKPDRDYLGTKLTVRFDSMLKVIQSHDELWQLNCEEP